LHGHVLIWHKQLPNWIQTFKGEPLEWEGIMKTHIDSVMRHFKGKVNSWDVVNEAFNEDGTLRNTIWMEKIGDTYIEKAFTFAHKADPEALLFYNEHGLEVNPIKRSAVLKYLNNLKGRGVKI